MIHHPIKILLVEDNPGDVLLLQETLADTTAIYSLCARSQMDRSNFTAARARI